jgi:predicted Zn-dependent protease
MDLPFQVSLRDALRSAAGRVPAAFPDARVFAEDRVQAAISAAPSGPPERTVLRVVGVALPGSRTLHLSDPSLSQLTGGREDEPLSGILSVPSLPLDAWDELVRQLARDRVAARVVAFHQNIWVASRDDVVEDARQAARVELKSVDDPGVALDFVISPSEAFPTHHLGGRVRERARERRGSVALDPSRDGPPLVLAAGLGGIVVHELVGHALEGDVARAGSRLGGMAEAFASKLVRVIDDPSLSRAAWRIDDEGVTPRAVTLVNGGRVTGRLLDRAAARADGAMSTGHGRCGGYLDPVLPRMGCTFVDRGPSNPEEIVRETARGIFVRRLVAAHADPREGRATFIVTDSDRIEAGRIAHPLRPFVVELDAIDTLASIDRVGDDLVFDTCVGSCVRAGQPLAVSVGAPTVRIGLIKVIL